MSKIIQYSTIGALMSGHFAGNFSLQNSHSPTLFGLGCSNGISGELTICNGEFWEATAGESLHQLADRHLPFLQVTDFVAENSFEATNIQDKNLDQRLAERLAIKNIFLADYQVKQTIEISNPTSGAYSSLNIDVAKVDELIGQVEK